MIEAHDGQRRMKWEMFALSFTALFLEMMVIRWVPSVVHLVAYYANLMLLSSFLGLGAGAMAAEPQMEPLRVVPRAPRRGHRDAPV